MRALLLVALLSSGTFTQGCDPRELLGASPEQVRQKAAVALKPYFPQVQVAIDTRRQMLVGYTCTDLGRPFLEMMPNVLDAKPEVQQMKQFRTFIGLQAFAIGFEQQVLYLELSSGKYFISGCQILGGIC